MFHNKFASETIPSPELPLIEVTILIKFKLKVATIIICLFTYMLFVYLFTFYYQYSVRPQGLNSKYPFMVYILYISRLLFSCLICLTLILEHLKHVRYTTPIVVYLFVCLNIYCLFVCLHLLCLFVCLYFYINAQLVPEAWAVNTSLWAISCIFQGQ